MGVSKLMESFVYFNQRLMEKLNSIYAYPFTIVSGGIGIGKTFSIKNYLNATRAEAMWHVIKEKEFTLFLREFIQYLSNWGIEVNEKNIINHGKNESPADFAVNIASILKDFKFSQRNVYVVEYKGKNGLNEIMEFMFYLACQNIKGFRLILTLQDGEEYRERELDSNVNYILEECFLLTPREIKFAFHNIGISIGNEEAQYLYLCSGGWMPIVQALAEKIKKDGKRKGYENAEHIVESVLMKCGNSARSIPIRKISPQIGSEVILKSSTLEQLIEKYALSDARIALEMEKIVAKNQESIDTCVHYDAVLLVLEGKCTKASEKLLLEFEWRIQNEQWESAFCIFISGLQLQITFGGQGFEEEKELLRKFATLRITCGFGISIKSACIALLKEREYYRFLAFVTTEESLDGGWADSCYREYMLAVAYKKIENKKEMKSHLEAAQKLMTDLGAVLTALMFWDYFNEKDREYAEISIKSCEGFEEKLKLWYINKKKNNSAYFADSNIKLAPREEEIVNCIKREMTNKEIANQLNISENTVKASLKKIFRKLDISSRKELQRR